MAYRAPKPKTRPLMDTPPHRAPGTAPAADERPRPRTPAFFIRLGNLLNRRGDPHLALAAYDRALQRSPGSRTALRNRALTLWRLGRIEDAARTLRRVVDLAPADGRARFELGLLRRRQGRLHRAAVHLQKAVCLEPRSGRAWIHLGDTLKLMGEAGRALEAYRRAALELPGQAQIHYRLGATLNALGRREEARRQLARTLRLDPAHDCARHLLCALQGKTPDRAPAAYVRRLFDRYAIGFDRQMRGPLAYRIPARLAGELAARRGGRRQYRSGLDLGCGTGLAGAAMRPWTRSLTGVDLSPGMLAAARAKGLYDRLVCQDVVAFLEASHQCFDLMVAADVVIYLGDVRPLLTAARRRLAAGGRLFLSTEGTRYPPFRLRRTGRFVHHRGYIEDLAAACGFVIERRRSLVIRRERDGRVHGDLFILG